jgi:c-di-GMP-binding flagellar brake protein YcgR
MKESPHPDPYDEKREYFRLTVQLPVDYRLEEEETRSVPRPMSVNLSGGGVGFVTQRTFNLGDTLVLRIVLPSSPPLTAKAKIVRMVPLQKDQSSFSIGAQFTELDHEDQERILKFLLALDRKRRQDHYNA